MPRSRSSCLTRVLNLRLSHSFHFGCSATLVCCSVTVLRAQHEHKLLSGVGRIQNCLLNLAGTEPAFIIVFALKAYDVAVLLGTNINSKLLIAGDAVLLYALVFRQPGQQFSANVLKPDFVSRSIVEGKNLLEGVRRLYHFHSRRTRYHPLFAKVRGPFAALASLKGKDGRPGSVEVIRHPSVERSPLLERSRDIHVHWYVGSFRPNTVSPVRYMYLLIHKQVREIVQYIAVVQWASMRVSIEDYHVSAWVKI